MERRGFLTLFGAGAVTLLETRGASASVARALTLTELVARSTSVLVVTGTAKRSSWQTIGGSRRIVTDMRARVEELVAGTDPSAGEVVIRTLGGRVGGIGELVEGEAELTLGEASLTFIKEVDSAVFGVTAMGQGHYPVASETRGQILHANRQLPALIGGTNAAVHLLPGHLLSEGLDLVRAERR